MAAAVAFSLCRLGEIRGSNLRVLGVRKLSVCRDGKLGLGVGFGFEL
jgi:hypothetical protein